MGKKDDFSDMKLTAVLKKFMEDEEWKDEIEIDDERKNAVVDTRFQVNQQLYRLLLKTDENGEIFTVVMVSPFNVPPARIGDMARILNRFNGGIRFGQLSCGDDGDANPVVFDHAIDVEGSKLAPLQIANMIEAACGTFRTRIDLLAAVAVTKQPIEDLWSNFLEEVEKKRNEAETGPSEL